VASSGAAPQDSATKFGWKYLSRRWTPIRGESDESLVCLSLKTLGARAEPTAGRYQSHDLEVTLGIADLEPGLYEVKRLSLRKGGKSVDRRFKAGRRGETIYGRRDAEIKSFAMALEDFLDQCLWSVEAIVATHEFIDQALQRRHGKKFHERLLRLANRSLSIPELMFEAKSVIQGGVRPQDITAGFSSLKGIFVIADHIYTLVKPEEYTRFIGFDSASAEGPKLSYQGVVPLESFATEKKVKR
jgi:hypothetical protein